MKYQIVLQYLILNLFLLIQLEIPASNFAPNSQNTQFPVSAFTTANKF